jgi:hypothetical protein
VYDLHFDPGERVLYIRMHGFWSAELLARFGAEVFAAGARIREQHDGFAILTDARACPVQSGEVAAGLHDLSLRSAAMNPAPIATVVSSALVALQGRRVLTPSNYRVFVDYGEALAWIDAAWVRRDAA